MKRTASIILSIIMAFNMVTVYSFGGLRSYGLEGDQEPTTVEETTENVNDITPSNDEETTEPTEGERSTENPGEGEQEPESEQEQEPVELVDVSFNINWIDSGDNEKSRPDGKEYMKVLSILVYDSQGTQVGKIDQLPEDAEYTESGTSGGKVTCHLPKFDKEGNPLTYKFQQDNEKLRTQLHYLSQAEPGDSPIRNVQAIDFTVNIQSIDGANTIDGVTHVDFMGKRLEEGNILSLKADGQEFDFSDLPDHADWTFDADKGIGTYVIKNIPRFDDNDNETNYTLTMNADEEKGQGADKQYFFKDKTGRYEIVNDNTEVPNHGSDTEFIANGGTIKLTLKDSTDYRATKYWLDENPADRPNADFELWRYTDMKDGSKGYKTASPVRDSSNQQIQLKINGPSAGVQTDIVISAEDVNSIVNIDEPLEKYDAKGYEYVYFLKEKMEGGNGSYEQLLDPEVTIKDGKAVAIVEHSRSDENDKSIYNEGTVANRISEDTAVQVPKQWKAQSYIDKIKHIEVEMKLKTKAAGESEEWKDALDEEGNPVTMSKDGFSSVFPVKTFSRTMPKYDKLGQKLEYKWIENEVRENGENILNEEKDRFKTELNRKNSWDPARKDVVSGHEILRQNDEYYTSEVEDGIITNRLEGVVDFIVEKKWHDADGNTVDAPEGATASFAIVNNQGIPPVFVTLDGTVDNYEEYPWIGHVKDIPKYTEDGALIEYSVHEANFNIPGYIGTILNASDDRITTIVNEPGEGLMLPVMKEWIDDEDSGCRYDSIVAAFYKDPKSGEVTDLSEKYGKYVTITAEDGWFKKFAVPSDFIGKERVEGDPKWDAANYYFREVALKSRDADGYMVEDSNQYNDLKGVETVTTDNHMYVTEYGRTSEDEGSIFVVKNRRVGTVDVTVTKTWTDKGADKTKRPEATLELAVKEGTAVVNKSKSEDDGYVLAEDVKKVKLPTVLEVDRTVDSGVETEYTFKGLPKYDKEGKVITYDVKEVWKDSIDAQSKDYTTSSTSDYKDRVKLPKPVRDLLIVELPSTEEFDQMTVAINNYRSNIDTVKFYKEWDDDYAYIHGKRPDIYVELYSTSEKTAWQDAFGLNDEGGDELKPDVQPVPLGYKTNEWSLDDRPDRIDSSRFWMVSFENQPRYTTEGELITYYAMESTNGSVKQFDYQDTQFKRDDLTDVTLEDPDTWVQTATDGNTVMRENGTFVNQVKNTVKLIGKKIWKNIPEGYNGKLPVININLQRYLTNDESREIEQVKDDDGKDVQIKNMTTPEGEKTLTFTINEDDQQHAEPHYNYSPEKYNHEGVLYGFTFEEEVLDVTNRSNGEVELKNLFQNSTDGNMILTNIYPGENYKGEINITKEWKNRPEELKENYDQYPAVTFKLYRVYENMDGERTTDVVKTHSVPATEFRTQNPKINFGGETFPIYAPDGFKYIYYIEENYVHGYDHPEYLTDISGAVTMITEPSDLAEKGGFTFNKPDDVHMAVPVAAVGKITNTYKPEKTKITGTKEWADRNNVFNTRPSIEDAQAVLNLTLYKYADKQSGQNNAIGSKSNPIVVKDKDGNPVQPDSWTVASSNANRWVFTYENLDLWAPNGTKWKYFVKEEISDEYKALYAPDKTWDVVSGNDDGTSASMGAKTNHLTKSVKVTKQWTAKDYMIRPKVAFEMQVKVGDGSWRHARNVEPFKSAGTITSDEGVWTYILEDKGSSKQAEYSHSWDNFPAKVKVDGKWQDVDYRFVEIKVGNYEIFKSHDDTIDSGECVADPLVYPTVDAKGAYQPDYIGESKSKSGEYDVITSTTKNDIVGGEVSLEVNKTWKDDFDDAYSTRPDSIVFKIQRKTEDDTEFSDYKDNKGTAITFNVTKSNNWTGKVEHLPKYSEDGKLFDYQAVETVPVNYSNTNHQNSATEDKFITAEENTLQTVDISGTKTWNTPKALTIEDGKVQLTLKAKADGEAEHNINYQKNNGQPEWSVQGQNVFKYEYTGLPKYNKAGKEYSYRVVESPVSGYVAKYDDTNLKVENVATELELDKIDKDTGEQISAEDLELTLYDSTGKTAIATWTRESGNRGTFTLVDGIKDKAEYANLCINGLKNLLYCLPTGKYVVKETKTPEHYNKADDITVSVTATNTVGHGVVGTVADMAKGTAIKFQKIDAETGNELAGAEFTLSDGTKNWTLKSDKGTFSQSELRPGTYTLKETKHPAGYPESIEGNGFECKFEITNDDKDTVLDAAELIKRATDVKGEWYKQKGVANYPSHIDIPVEKTWNDNDDQDGLRKEVTVKLLADGRDTGKTVKLNAENKWKSTFEDLTEYVDGKRVKYTIEEVKVDYYKTEITGDMDKGFTIKNSHTPFVTEISGHKTWTDADDQDGFRPESITIKLKADGEYVDGKEVTVTADDEWAWKFDKLPKFKDGGKLINYTFEETAFDGKVLPEEGTEEYYEVSYKVTEEEKADPADGLKKIEVTNTHKPVQIEVPVEKIWNDADDQDGIRPADITVQLLADGTPVEDKILTLNDENEWKGSFTELDKYRDGGIRIVYTIEEITVDEYATAVEGDMDEGFVVTNSHEPYIISIEGNKIWDDADDQDGFRPESITVRLLADGVEIDSKVVTEDDDWAWRFTDLPKRQAGMDINYVITEDAITTPDGKGNYTPSFEYSEVEETTPEGELNRTFRQIVEVTNTHNPCKVCVPVTKCWDDGNNADGIRPKAIDVQLYADDEAVEGKVLTLNEKNNWAGMFADLDEFKENGQTIDYTIEEIAVKDYETKLTGDNIKGYILTNKHTPKDGTETGDPTKLLALMGITGSLAGLCAIFLSVFRRRREE